MPAIRCTQCGGDSLELGFVEDQGDHSRGFLRWIQGPLMPGPMGGARRAGRPRWQIDAYRCTTCFHLELFAGSPT